jgi:hypothetical protein
MKVACIFFKRVVGSEIHTPAKPPDWIGLTGCCARERREEPHVEMDRWHIRVTRVDHERHTHCFERTPGYLGALRTGRGGEVFAPDVREQNRAALEDLAVLNDAGNAASAFGATPVIGTEAAAITFLERSDDPGLKASQEVPDCVDVRQLGSAGCGAHIERSCLVGSGESRDG